MAPTTGVGFKDASYSKVVEALEKHLKANGCLPQDAKHLVQIQTAARLKSEGYDEWLK